jgi:hypothetical protein
MPGLAEIATYVESGHLPKTVADKASWLRGKATQPCVPLQCRAWKDCAIPTTK